MPASLVVVPAVDHAVSKPYVGYAQCLVFTSRKDRGGAQADLERLKKLGASEHDRNA